MSEENNQLITYQDLATEDPEILFKKDKLNKLLNRPPRAKWLKKNKFAGNREYLPVDKHEWLMTVIFQQWRREIKNIQLMANSVVATVRVWYLHPVTGQWEYHDGVGAVPLQTESGAKAMQIDRLQTNAVQLAAPAAASYALKDACECLGKLFGKDLGKPDAVEFNGLYSNMNEVRQEDSQTEGEEINVDNL